MQGNVTIRTGGGAEPVSLVEAKLQCRADADLTDEDSTITAMISAARVHVESVTNRAMVTQGFRATFPCFPCKMALRAPARKVLSVTYMDTSGDSQTLAAADYDVDLSELSGIVTRAYAATWPSTYEHPAAVAVNFTAGYATQFTVDTATNILTAAGHPFADGDVVRAFNTGGGLPGALAARTDYYAIGVSGNTLQLSLTEGGAAIDITSAGTGTHFIGGPDDAAWIAMRQAMLLMIGHWDKNRADSGDFPVHEIPNGARALLMPHKVWGI